MNVATRRTLTRTLVCCGVLLLVLAVIGCRTSAYAAPTPTPTPSPSAAPATGALSPPGRPVTASPAPSVSPAAKPGPGAHPRWPTLPWLPSMPSLPLPLPKVPVPAIPDPFLPSPGGGLIDTIIRAVTTGVFSHATAGITDGLARTYLGTPQLTAQPRIRDLWQASFLTMLVLYVLYVLFVLAGGILLMGHESVQTRYAFRQILPRIAAAFVAAARIRLILRRSR